MSLTQFGSPFEIEEELGEGIITEEMQEQLRQELAASQPVEELQPETQPQPSTGGIEPTLEKASTEPEYSGETVELNGKQYPIEDIRYETNIFGQRVANLTPEAARRQNRNKEVTYLGQPLSEANTQIRERLSALGQGLMDFGIETINFFLPKNQKFAKPSRYEDGVAEGIRNISSVVAPTLMLGGALQSAGVAANTRIGWGLGQSRFVQWVGSRGTEALASTVVGGVSDQYTGDNLSAQISSLLPPQYDFIPDNWQTVEGMSPDQKRQLNINEDLALGFLVPLVGSAGKFLEATGNVRRAFRPTQIVGETPEAVEYLARSQPEDAIRAQARKLWDDSPDTITGENNWDLLPNDVKENLTQSYIESKLIDINPETIDLTHYTIKQDDALTELGMYNYMRNPDNQSVALKGIHDLFDWNEIGLRTVDDFGIIGAAVDAARIYSNSGTVNGRLGSIISQPAVKFAGTTPGATEDVVLGLANELKQANSFGAIGNDWSLTSADIAVAGDRLIVEMVDPKLTIDEIKDIIEPLSITTPDGNQIILEGGYSTIFENAGDLSSVNIAKAQAYLQTSLAGQISDAAEGVRLNRESSGALSGIEKIRDNLMMLYKLAGTNRYYSGSKNNLVNRFQQGIDPSIIQQSSDEIVASYPAVRDKLHQEALDFGNTIKWFEDNEPDLLDSFLELYELSDGRINNINKLNEDIRNSFTKWRVLWDENPEAKNILAGAIRSNYMNSLLGSLETGANALYGNLGGIIAQPLSYFAGAVSRRNLKDIQRGWMAYSAIFDTQKKALPYAGKLFMKASQNPNSVGSQTKLDFIIQSERKLNAYREIAQVEAEKGNFGLQYLIDQYEMWHSMAQDPVFRFIPNMFTGFDGWAKSTLANAEARFRAMDQLEQNGLKISRQEVKRLADAQYNSMFDAKGDFIVDEAVKYQSDEVALNVNTKFTQALNQALSRVPVMRSFMLLPTSTSNFLKQIDDFAPLSLFQRDLNQLAYTSVEMLASRPELVDDLLTQRGYQIDQLNVGQKLRIITDIKNRTLGKKAITSLVTLGLSGMILNDQITGDGFYDKELQKSRMRNSNWKARTIEINGERFEYEKVLGPGLSDWVATFVNIHDNFDKLGQAKLENLRQKMWFLLGATYTDKTVLSSLRPLVEILQGNDFAWNRWAAGMVNTLGPLGGARAEASRIMSAGLKEIEGDFLSLIDNRNAMFFMDQANRLPFIYNPVTGQVPNNYSMLQRMWNAWSPLKIHPGQTEEERFLQDIEYDYSTTFQTFEGVQLRPQERSELLRLMGEQGYFRKQIKRISREAAVRNTVEELQLARDQGFTSEQVPIEYYDQIHMMLRGAQKDAEKLAYGSLPNDMRIAIQARILERNVARENAQKSRIDETLNIRK